MKNLRDDHQRLWDIVRFFRSEALDKNLITEDEYGPLAIDHAAVARLEKYDRQMETEADLQKEVGRLGTELAVAMSTILRLETELKQKKL